MSKPRTIKDVFPDGSDLDIEEARLEVLADILALPCLQESNSLEMNPDAVGGYNYALEKVRQALSAYFMGGDVGVDNGDSE